MKTLLVLRHAKSSWKDPGLSDHDRPLNQRGRTAAPRMGRLLAELGLRPDCIVCSTARRARQTASRVARAGAFDCEIDFVDRMYGADADDLVDVVRGVPDDVQCVLMIGHNPGLEEFVQMLTRTDTTLPTAALARIALDVDAWSEVGIACRGELVETWRPRELS